MKTILVTLFTIISAEVVFSQDTSVAGFLPLAVGNVWVYNWHEYQPIPPINSSGIYVVRLTGSFVANNKLYFSISRVGGGCSPAYADIFNNQALRLDSGTGNLYAYTPGQGCSNTPDEKMIDSLAMQLDDYSFISCGTYVVQCTDTTSHIFFGIMRQSKGIGNQGPEAGNGDMFAKGFGVFGFGNFLMNHSCSYELKGCVINGIVYGDTGTVIGVKPISTAIPKSFSLFQNYPNPFNPTTKIRFDIPASKGVRGMAKITVYDAVGRLIAQLVDELLIPGTYEVDFDGSNLPSGIYFYVLSSTDFSESKRMVLLK